MIHALSWSGGKDAMLALDRAVRRGLDVRFLFNIHEGSSGRVRFHGVRRELIAAQADALGLELIETHTDPGDYESALIGVLETLKARGVGSVLFGNIHLEDIRDWYDERLRPLGLAHGEPLWGDPLETLLDEFLDRGYRTRIVSVNLEMGRAEWLGRELDRSLIEEIRAVPDADIAGERGEYHTFVFDGPLFRRPVPTREAGTFERDGHRILDLVSEGYG